MQKLDTVLQSKELHNWCLQHNILAAIWIDVNLQYTSISEH
jgi:hypothetical protein